jgi:hypothetical protein
VRAMELTFLLALLLQSEDMSRRCSEILSSSAPNVLQVLAMYIAADGAFQSLKLAKQLLTFFPFTFPPLPFSSSSLSTCSP